MSPDDRISIILFNDDARVLCGLKRLTPAGQTSVGLLIDQIEADGGTTIAGGLGIALDVIEKRTQKNKSCAVLLLSDGQDQYQSRSSGLSPYESLKRRAESHSCPVFTFGIGADHDAACLSILACSGGAFTFVDTMDMVRGAFAGAVGALKGIAVKECRVSLEVPSGCRISEVISGYPVESRTSGRVVVCFNDAYYEEERLV
jgi:hypothetical protein